MITLNLSRADNAEGIYLNLPAPPAKINYAFSELDKISSDTSTTKIVDVVSNVYNLNDYLKSADVEQPGILDKIGELARILQTMDRDSCLKFEGVLDANSVNGIDDILRLSESLDQYTLIHDAASGSTLGKYLVNNGAMSFPERIRPYLDYQIIGEEFYADHGGAFCRAGYVVRNDELPEQLRQSKQNEKRIMALRLRVNHDGTPKTSQQTLALPTAEAELEQTKQNLRIDAFAEADIIMVDYSFPYLAQMIPQECISVEDANELALCVEQMDQKTGELLKFLSVLEAERPETFPAALNLAMDIDDYERVPIAPEEYGRMALQRIGADDELINTIDGYMDFESYGKECMQDDGVVQTEFGSLRRLSQPFDTQVIGGMQME
ncbi:antirestriction protein ArdA [Anaerotruncus rubiinfantis]|uniref:antirestriction protein ArdA n=1 Tax=Anaerotruncus rubiinfantis TaxID=1720200 RepID=UPI0018972F70|nr:antirestriction protein ArdA [Anaerotruncus rubiinfantis]